MCQFDTSYLKSSFLKKFYRDGLERVLKLFDAGVAQVRILLFHLKVPLLAVSRHQTSPRFDVDAEDAFALVGRKERRMHRSNAKFDHFASLKSVQQKTFSWCEERQIRQLQWTARSAG